MEYTDTLAIKFWKNAEKAVGKYQAFDASATSICAADIKESVRHAFRDLTVRTMVKNNTHKNEAINLDELAREACTGAKGLSSLIEKMLNAPQTEASFDKWHKETCEQVVAFLKNYYESTDCSYGKAQKIVNMSLKNLYALCVVKGIADNYALHFQYCHVPLDSFTLEWCYRESIRQKVKITKGKMASWSAICVYGDKDTDEYETVDRKKYYTYFYFQKLFRNWYKNSITPLQAEFIYWPRIQKELAAENFLFSLNDFAEDEDESAQKKKQKIKSMSLEDKIDMIRDFLNT